MRRRASEVGSVLQIEFRRLQKLVPAEEVMHVQWNPWKRTDLSGEVKGDTIFIYDDNIGKALVTLRHEYLDCLLTRRLVDPLVTMVNALTKIRENEIYRGKERIVNLLSAVIDTSPKAT